MEKLLETLNKRNKLAEEVNKIDKVAELKKVEDEINTELTLLKGKGKEELKKMLDKVSAEFNKSLSEEQKKMGLEIQILENAMR